MNSVSTPSGASVQALTHGCGGSVSGAGADSGLPTTAVAVVAAVTHFSRKGNHSDSRKATNALMIFEHLVLVGKGQP